MTTTSHQEIQGRARRVLEYLRQHGPSHSMQIAAGTGLSQAGVAVH